MTVTEHTYTSGKPFYLARCNHYEHGPLLLNSGHHYQSRADAEAECARHDEAEHADPDDCYCDGDRCAFEPGGSKWPLASERN